jgi:hypothetical protein
MRERAAQAGARLEVASSPGDGTRIEILMPHNRHRDVDNTSGGRGNVAPPEDDGGAE